MELVKTGNTKRCRWNPPMDPPTQPGFCKIEWGGGSSVMLVMLVTVLPAKNLSWQPWILKAFRFCFLRSLIYKLWPNLFQADINSQNAKVPSFTMFNSIYHTFAIITLSWILTSCKWNTLKIFAPKANWFNVSSITQYETKVWIYYIQPNNLLK